MNVENHLVTSQDPVLYQLACFMPVDERQFIIWLIFLLGLTKSCVISSKIKTLIGCHQYSIMLVMIQIAVPSSHTEELLYTVQASFIIAWLLKMQQLL
jgi:hypothetical protein